MSRTVGCATLLALVVLATASTLARADEGGEPAAGPSDVVELTDFNFESETQASSGSTTGDWLVELYAPWCGFCKRIAPVYEKVATAVKEDPNTNVIVAKIDGSSNRLTFKRFEGTHFPTIVFVHNGRYLKYNGQRTEEDLLKFVQGGWREAEEEEWTAVPEPMTLIGGILDTIASEFITLIDDLRKLSTTKLPVVTAVFSAGVLVGVVLTFLAVTCLPGGSKANKLRSKRKDADKPKAD